MFIDHKDNKTVENHKVDQKMEKLHPGFVDGPTQQISYQWYKNEPITTYNPDSYRDQPMLSPIAANSINKTANGIICRR